MRLTKPDLSTIELARGGIELDLFGSQHFERFLAPAPTSLLDIKGLDLSAETGRRAVEVVLGRLDQNDVGFRLRFVTRLVVDANAKRIAPTLTSDLLVVTRQPGHTSSLVVQHGLVVGLQAGRTPNASEVLKDASAIDDVAAPLERNIRLFEMTSELADPIAQIDRLEGRVKSLEDAAAGQRRIFRVGSLALYKQVKTNQ